MTENIEVRVTTDFAELDRLLATMPEKRDEFVRAVAFRVQGRAQEIAPVLTGALKNSIFTKTTRYNGYGEAVMAALGSNVKASISDDPTPMAQTGVAYVAPAVEYAYWVEFGTSRRAAHPYLLPALEMVATHEAKDIAREVFGNA